jgi:hypothetical protein
MSGRSDITAQAEKIYASGLKLAKEISDMIVDTVTRHATDIEGFVNRRDELLEVDARFLYFFAIAVELDFASATWQDQKTRDIIEGIAHLASQEFQFRSSSLRTERELATLQDDLQDNLLKMYDNLEKNWCVLRKGTVSTEKAKDDLTYIFVLYYLRHVYPAIKFFIGTGKLTGNLCLFVSLQRQFALKMIPSQFQQPSPNEEAASPGSIVDRGSEN